MKGHCWLVFRREKEEAFSLAIKVLEAKLKQNEELLHDYIIFYPENGE